MMWVTLQAPPFAHEPMNAVYSSHQACTSAMLMRAPELSRCVGSNVQPVGTDMCMPQEVGETKQLPRNIQSAVDGALRGRVALLSRSIQPLQLSAARTVASRNSSLG